MWYLQMLSFAICMIILVILRFSKSLEESRRLLLWTLAYLSGACVSILTPSLDIIMRVATDGSALFLLILAIASFYRFMNIPATNTNIPSE